MTVAIVPEIVERTPDEWVQVIKADLGGAVAGIISAGQHLVEAKADLPHGSWLPTVERIGISDRAARMLMSVASNHVLANRKHVSDLPSSWGTLYQLSRLEPEVLEGALQDGAITPDMERKAAANLVRQQKQPTTFVERTPLPTGKVSTFVADPPWRYGNTSTRGAAEDHYDTMTIEDLCALDIVKDKANEQSHLYLWTTAGHLPEAFKVMEAWGFEYKTYLVWVKPQMGMGNYFRVSTELVLFGIRGGLLTQANDIMNYFQSPRAKHSAKPLEFHDLVEKASPGPYMELFSRCHANDVLHSCTCSKCRLGWTVWGNQS